jgi:nucleotide-binding universal stress UspA family protein
MVTLFAATMTATGAGAMIARVTSNGEDAMYRQVARSNIVVGVDGSRASVAAVRWAAREAMMRLVPIKLINVVAPTLVSSAMAPNHTITQGEEHQARQILNQARRIVEELAGEKRPDIHTERQYAGVVPTLVDASNDAQLVVLGSSRRASGRGMLGSVSAGLLHHANCPVAVVPDPESTQHGIRDAPVLVGIDGSTASEGAAALAFDEASRRGVPLMALQAWSDVGVLPILGMDWRTNRDKGAELLGERLAGWQERYPDVQVHRRLVCDVPDRWLIEESKNAQLVVLGSGGRGGYAGMHLGSVTSAVVRSARVPVIVVRHREHEPADHEWIRRVWGWV